MLGLISLNSQVSIAKHEESNTSNENKRYHFADAAK
jgi:hypothetical protein